MPNVVVEKHGRTTLIKINRPERRNAICLDTSRELQSAFKEFDASDQRVAVLCGEGDKAFCAGADNQSPPESWRAMPGVGFATDKPIIAATSGWVIGVGVVIMTYCDLVVSDETTQFSYPEAKLGITGGMISGLVARIPLKAAMDLMLLARTMNARRAYEVGLINDVTPPGGHIALALEHADQLCYSSPLVIKTLKRFTAQMVPKSPPEQMLLASQLVDEVKQSEDRKEGVAAFKEKRRPQFKGR